MDVYDREFIESMIKQKSRLDYAVLQLSREAKFLPESKPENRRFYRAYDTVVEVRDEIERLLLNG